SQTCSRYSTEELQFDDDFRLIDACCASHAMSLNASPGLAAAEDWQSDISPHSESGAPGIETHACLVELSGLRIEYRAAFVVQSRLLHAFNEHQAKHRLIVLRAGAFGTDRVGIVAWVEEQARKPADEPAVLFAHRDNSAHLAVLVDLLPHACRRRRGRARLG